MPSLGPRLGLLAETAGVLFYWLIFVRMEEGSNHYFWLFFTELSGPLLINNEYI